MKNRMKRLLTGMMLMTVLVLMASFPSLASRIAFSDPSATAGETFTVKMKITATENETIGKAVVMLSYDSSMLEFVSGDGVSGGAGSLRVEGSTDSATATELSFTMTFRALRAGSTSVTIASQEVYDADSQMLTVGQEGSSSITVAAAAGDSANASLAGLQVSPGSLTPAFSPDVDTYTVSVGADVTSIIVDAPAVDAGASVSVSGNEDLQMGENQVVCTVTAQDGQTVKTYTITVIRSDEAAADGEEAVDNVVLRTPERSVLVRLVTEGIEIPDGFVPCSVSIDEQEVQGWVWGADSADPQYCIFYATNSDGESGFYRYDLTEKTLQRYFRDPLVDAEKSSEYTALATEYNSLLNDYNFRFYIIVGLIVLAAVLLIVIIALIATRGGRDDFYEKRQDNSNYPEKRKSERQKQASAAAQADHRRISREERYMRGMEEEEDAAEQEEMFRAEQQIRERQAQRRQAARAQQAMQSQQAQRQAAQQAMQSQQAQRQAAQQAMQSQQIQRQAAQQAMQSQQIQRQAAQQTIQGQTGQRQAAQQTSQAQRQAAQQTKRAAAQTQASARQQVRRPAPSEDVSYVVRGPLPSDDGADEPVRTKAESRPRTDDDFDFLDIE